MEVVGAGFTVKTLALVAVPLALVTVTNPVVPDPTTATICVEEIEVIEATGVPPILTFAAVAPVNLVPFIVIVDPIQPFVELKLVMVGGTGVHL
ncbi:hypothetical protein FLB_23190 [Flavobacterium succinicans]|uniref:Uncharacterized protein n=1 Tax=Flavobacterium succinicans TaxID=29536 RepID=A0A199XPF5_9FLAO|nr:hypothetical protein FLB_23190 [Flavobacterium succinicans]